MKLMVSTPCANGLLYLHYMTSLLNSLGQAQSERLITEFELYVEGKESLIHRARNHAALYFLKRDYDKLLTIDADVSWTYEDFKRIVTSDKDIVGGIYPLKTFPIVGNFNPLPGKGDELFKTNRGYDLDAIRKIRDTYGNPITGEVEVMHVPTGFTCTTRKVFSELSKTVPVYGTLDAATGRRENCYEFYPSYVINGQLESEDWGFCRIAKEAGFKIYSNTNVLLGHTGYHTYQFGQVYGEMSIKRD